MTRTMAAANSEFCISLRNRWVAIAVVLMALFSFVLSAAGSAPTGQLGVDKLSITVASLTSLAVYLFKDFWENGRLETEKKSSNYP